MRKTQTLMNKPVYLGLSILDLSKTVMYGFWYYYVKPSMVKMENFVIYGYRQLCGSYKNMIFTKILQEMLK